MRQSNLADDESEVPHTRQKSKAGLYFRPMTSSTEKIDRSHWTLEVVDSFEEAEAKARADWHAATSDERFSAAAQIKEIVYGKSAATARLQRVLEVLPES